MNSSCWWPAYVSATDMLIAVLAFIAFDNIGTHDSSSLNNVVLMVSLGYSTGHIYMQLTFFPLLTMKRHAYTQGQMLHIYFPRMKLSLSNILLDENYMHQPNQCTSKSLKLAHLNDLKINAQNTITKNQQITVKNPYIEITEKSHVIRPITKYCLKVMCF